MNYVFIKDLRGEVRTSAQAILVPNSKLEDFVRRYVLMGFEETKRDYHEDDGCSLLLIRRPIIRLIYSREI